MPLRCHLPGRREAGHHGVAETNNGDIEADHQVSVEVLSPLSMEKPHTESLENDLSSSTISSFPYSGISGSFSMLSSSTPSFSEHDNLLHHHQESFSRLDENNMPVTPVDHHQSEINVNMIEPDHGHHDQDQNQIESQSPPAAATNANYSDENLHPILKVIKKQDMTKSLLPVVVIVMFAIIANDKLDAIPKHVRSSIVSLLLISFTALWCGNLMKEEKQILGNRIELVGYVVLFLALCGVFAYLLWPSYSVVPIICCIVCLGVLRDPFFNVYIDLARPGS